MGVRELKYKGKISHCIRDDKGDGRGTVAAMSCAVCEALAPAVRAIPIGRRYGMTTKTVTPLCHPDVRKDLPNSGVSKDRGTGGEDPSLRSG